MNLCGITYIAWVLTGWKTTLYTGIGSNRIVQVIWCKDTQELGSGQISIMATYKNRERHGIIYWKGFWGNKPQVHISPLNNHAWATQLTWLLKGNPTPLPPIQPLQAHLWHFPACTGWYIKGRDHLPLA